MTRSADDLPPALFETFVAAMRALPDIPREARDGARARELFARADLHGLAGVLHDAFRAGDVASLNG